MTSREIRETFLRFFASQGHTRVASSSLVPAGDPTLLFTNAGMVQFKKVFLGEDPRPYTRAASSQKCVRAGGKHNDLENVGFTARHHTFFEMLGNFSFGDYFKEGAIEMAWELLTQHYKLPADKLWATVFHEDEEAARLWEKITGLPPSRIIGLGEKDNFWAMGDTGPCGPCSEILIDQGEAMSCGPDCGIGKCECDRYLEIWNNVFMQYNRTADGVLTPLPKPSIDTGMGLERLCAVIQGVKSNFDCDLLRPVIAGIESLSGQAYGASETQNVPFRVIADHSRATAFLIADGVLPSNEGRGYVLRRIMRRAIRFGRLLNLPTPFLSRVCDGVVELMEDIYPELRQMHHIMTQVVTGEEERFADTLDHGLKLLGDELDYLKTHSQKILPGEVAFKLYDTYGFPLDLVQDTLREEGLVLDLEGFEAHMRAQREASRQSWKGGPGEELPAVYQELAEWPATNFLGYDALEGDSDILALIVESGHNDQAEAGEEVEVVTKATPFYGESGGQVGDTGVIDGDGWRIRVTATQKLPNDLIVHQGKVETGIVRVNDPAHLAVDAPRRRRIMAPSHRHPPPPGGPAASPGRPRQAVRLPGGPGAPALRLHPLPGHQPRGTGGHRTGPERRRGGQPAGAHRPDVHGPRPWRPGPPPCSRKNTARTCGWWPSPRSARSSAAAPTWSAPGTWACAKSPPRPPSPRASGASRRCAASRR